MSDERRTAADADADARLSALIERIAARDPAAGRDAAAEAALRALYDACAPRLFGLALRVLGHRDWAEDVLQESFLQVWRGAGDYRTSLSPPLAWMGMIVRSRALDFLRRRHAQRLDVAQPLDEAVVETVPSDSPDPMAAALASQQASALDDCMRRLEVRQREAVSMAYLRDLSHSEVAAQLRLPLGTVKTWIRRALDQLRGCMGRYA